MSTSDRDATISAQKERIIQLHGKLDDAWWAAWHAIWPVVGHGMEVWEADGHWERELAAVTAERDALSADLRMERASLDTVRGQRDDAMERVAAVEAERDALKRGQWAGPWEPCRPGFVRRERSGNAVTPLCAGSERPAADARLLAEGYYLAATPPTGTPGDGTR